MREIGRRGLELRAGVALLWGDVATVTEDVWKVARWLGGIDS